MAGKNPKKPKGSGKKSGDKKEKTGLFKKGLTVKPPRASSVAKPKPKKGKK